VNFLLRAKLIVPALVVFWLSLPVFSRLIAGLHQEAAYSDQRAHLEIAWR
jgi:hypothetical protein